MENRHFIDFIPGNKSEFLILDLTKKEISKKKDLSWYNPEDRLYCFDLYRPFIFFRGQMPFMWDLQSLNAIHHNRVEDIVELFEPDYSQRFNDLQNKVNNHLNSYKNCKIDTSGYSLEDLIPKGLFNELYKEKLLCIEIQTKKEKSNAPHQFYKEMYDKILSVYSMSLFPVAIDKKGHRIFYHIFGAKNSRISIRKNSVNIYNIPKEKRASIQPWNGGKLAQFDFKSFQPRLAMALFGTDEIKARLKIERDIYSLFDGDREENKLELISWMFSNRKNDKFDKELDCIKQARKQLYSELKQKGMLFTRFGRPLYFTDEEENVVFQNYICSTEADCLLSLIHDSTKDLKLRPLFPFHDCLIYCIFPEDFGRIKEIKEYMENYLFRYFGVNFPVSVSVGNDFLNLQKEENFTMEH